MPELDESNRYDDSDLVARFGRDLFFETGLSKDGSVSCATCHLPEHRFADPRPLSHGLAPNTRHAPTLVNAAHFNWFGWGGRADSLWSQALGPLESTNEMGSDRVQILRFIWKHPHLGRTYRSLFADPLPIATWPEHGLPGSADTDESRAVMVKDWQALQPEQQHLINQAFANIGKSLGAYQRRLRSADAPFDRFVAELNAGRTQDIASPSSGFGEAELRGFQIFIGEGSCVTCHSGPHFSDGEFHNTGAPPLAGGEPTDSGRFQGGHLVKSNPFRASGRFSDGPTGQKAERTRLLLIRSEQWGEFKTPSLRNLVGRGPYMHQGQFETLEQVVHFYNTLENSVGASHHQEQILVPLGLTQGQQGDLLAFLRALDGAPVPSNWAQPRAQ